MNNLMKPTIKSTRSIQLPMAFGKVALRPRTLVVVKAASKEEELAKMNEFKANLGQKLEAATKPPPPVVEEGKDLFEVTQDNYWATIKAAGDKLVVVDCYTDWCGPCKMIKPTLVQWNDDMADVQIVKFNCNSKNKDLGKSLGIKVAPTFFLYKKGDQVATMTGAKVDDLLKLIEQHK